MTPGNTPKRRYPTDAQRRVNHLAFAVNRVDHLEDAESVARVDDIWEQVRRAIEELRRR